MADGTQKAPKGWLIAGVICLLVGIGGCGAAGSTVVGLASLVDDIQETARFGETIRVTALSDGGGIAVLTSSAECTGVDGSGRMVEFSSVGSFSLEADGREFRHGLEFDTVEGETYEIRCGSSDVSGQYTVLPVPKLLGGLDIRAAVAIGVIGVFGGALFLILGIIFVIVGLVRRSKWKKSRGPGAPGPGAPYGAVPPPPGGQPSPGAQQYPGAQPYPGAPPAPGGQPPAGAPPGYPQTPPAPGVQPPTSPETYPSSPPAPAAPPAGYPDPAGAPTVPPAYEPPSYEPPSYEPPPAYDPPPVPPATPPEGGPDEPPQSPPPYPPPPPAPS